MKILLNRNNEYQQRHIGPSAEDEQQMLKAIGVNSLQQLVDETIPANIRFREEPELEEGMSEAEFLSHLRAMAAKNKVYKSYIGMGYYGTITPSVILRNVLENPGWYTQYTPYQAEISQGRLEALLNFQTMVSDLTGMEIANASLLDEATAAAEAMTMCHRLRPRNKREAHTFLVSDQVFPQTLAVLQTRARPLNITVKVSADPASELGPGVYGLLVQFPGKHGRMENFRSLFEAAGEKGILITAAADLLSLTLFTPPGEMGADIVVGSTQRFGVPMGYGGPHAAFFATRESYKRQVPGRIIGVSVDKSGKPAYRMALQTREQHIRREKATSNICTAQALLAIMAGFYGVYHGPEGLRNIAGRIRYLTEKLAGALRSLGYDVAGEEHFDTLLIATGELTSQLLKRLDDHQININRVDDHHVSLSLDETTAITDLKLLIHHFATVTGKGVPALSLEDEATVDRSPELKRDSPYMQHEVFRLYRSETEMMRYIKSLENKDLSLTGSMIPLGSCTMKLNPATAMLPITWPEFAHIHPFVPREQAAGYHALIAEMSRLLCAITGFDSISFQPNSGAQGEYAGLSVIRAYLEAQGEEQRNIVLIPTSAHGTNPASATMAGMKVVLVACDENGNVDVDDLRRKALEHQKDLAAFMITYPSTHGVFEEEITTMIDIIHEHGGQVYMDGANMNAQVGLTSPGHIGADVCHLNLHKTFSIPHGGGGPGVGPIAVAKHLAPYLPKHPLVETGGEQGLAAVAAAPYGSAGILPISYAYMKMLGGSGMRRASEMAILNANYLKARLQGSYKVLYSGKNGRVAHEMILDFRPFKNEGNVDVVDVAKRLMDYSFHAPTVAWPVPGTMMIEPTESESREELDRFCEAMLAIYDELTEIQNGTADGQDNVLKNAPHTVSEVSGDDWPHAYTRKKAAFPVENLRKRKFWPPVSRIDDTYGDRHLMCSCPSLDSYK